MKRFLEPWDFIRVYLIRYARLPSRSAEIKNALRKQRRQDFYTRQIRPFSMVEKLVQKMRKSGSGDHLRLTSLSHLMLPPGSRILKART
jgi:hypothetical protein